MKLLYLTISFLLLMILEILTFLPRLMFKFDLEPLYRLNGIVVEYLTDLSEKPDIKVKKKSGYFAIKESLIETLFYLLDNPTKESVKVGISINNNYSIITYRIRIINEFLGYDSRLSKARIYTDLKPKGKLYHKDQVMLLFTKLVDFEKEVEKLKKEVKNMHEDYYIRNTYKKLGYAGN